MERKKSYENPQEGKLYLVPTPIGNLQDMTFRSIDVLKEVALIAAEDTRNTVKLLNHFAIETPQISFHEHNYKERIPELVEKLKSGLSIAQVSDAGMPSISDPGHELVLACITEKIPVVPLPGATAGLTALIASGLEVQPFLFYGFLPRKKNLQQQTLTVLKEKPETLIFYESPYRIKETVSQLAKIFGNRQAVICRELTKLHEEFLRGTLEELAEELQRQPIKGECVLMVAGNLQATTAEETYPEDIQEHFKQLALEGYTGKEIIKEVAKKRGLKKQEVYRIYHEIEN